MRCIYLRCVVALSSEVFVAFRYGLQRILHTGGGESFRSPEQGDTFLAHVDHLCSDVDVLNKLTKGQQKWHHISGLEFRDRAAFSMDFIRRQCSSNDI